MPNTDTPTAANFSQVIQDTLNDLRGIKNEAVTAIANTYGPRLAALAASDDPQGEYDDIVTNAKLQLADLGVEAESEVSVIIGKVIQATAGVALKYALAL